METQQGLIVRVQNKDELEQEIKMRQDRFLDLYSFYIKTRISWIHDELKLKAYELSLVDSSFYFPV